MKRLLIFALVLLAGCAKLDKGADALVVRTEQMERGALTTFDFVLNVDNDNRDYFRANVPKFHEFAEWLRAPQPISATENWPRATAMIRSLQLVKVEYKRTREKDKLENAMAVFKVTLDQAKAWEGMWLPLITTNAGKLKLK